MKIPMTCREVRHTGPRFAEADGGNPTELGKQAAGCPVLPANNTTQQISNNTWGLENHFMPSVKEAQLLFHFCPSVCLTRSVLVQNPEGSSEEQFQLSPNDNTNQPQ